MHTNNANVKQALIHPELSYLLTGLFFDVHNTLGRYCREKQYGDLLEEKLRSSGLTYVREFIVKGTGNIADFIVENKILLELKATPFTTKQDYYQTQRYLQILNLKLGILVNFHHKYLKPLRIVLIETDVRKKFL